MYLHNGGIILSYRTPATFLAAVEALGGHVIGADAAARGARDVSRARAFPDVRTRHARRAERAAAHLTARAVRAAADAGARLREGEGAVVLEAAVVASRGHELPARRLGRLRPHAGGDRQESKHVV